MTAKDKFYRAYMEFFETAERKRRWNLFDDVPWNELSADTNTEERAIIEVSTGEMGNKPDAVKLGWLKMRTKETWTKQRYTKALGRTMEKLREAVAQAEKNKAD